MGRYARRQWAIFADVLKSGIRYNTFDSAYKIVSTGVSGLYTMEAKAVWDVISKEKIESIAEIGRNLGGSLFLYSCACPDLKYIRTIDIEYFALTDDLFPRYFKRHGIDITIETMDSTKAVADRVYDFVFIDGGHTGPIVKRDIEIWKDHARIIGFHDFADQRRNKHKRYYPDVVEEIAKARDDNGWEQMGKRGRSEVIFKTRNYQ